MIFEYKNAGFSDAHIWFEWKDLYGNSCSSLYNTVSTVYYTGNSSPPTPTPPLNPPNVIIGMNNSVLIPMGQSLFIKKTITITDCESSCPPGLKLAEIKWRCHNSTSDFCLECQNTYNTQFVFTHDVPKFNVTRTQPTWAYLEYDQSCLNSSEQWHVTVTNTSDHTSFNRVKLRLEDVGGAGSLATITSITSSPPLVITPNAPVQNGCGGLQSSTMYDIELPNPANFPPGASFSFNFIIDKCCLSDNSSYWNDMLGINKAINQWAITISEAETQCQGTIHPVLTSPTSDLDIGNSSHGISTHSEDLSDIDLSASFVNNGTHMSAPPKDCINGTPAAYSYGEASVQKIYFWSLFGDDFDLQTIGYDGNSSTPLNGILRCKISCNAGLIIESVTQPTPVILNYEQAANPGVIIPLSPSCSTNTNGSSINNVYHDGITSYTGMPNCLDGDYYFYFVLPSGIDDVKSLFNTGVLEFTLRSCCTAVELSEYNAEFSVLLNSNGTSNNCGNFNTTTCSCTNQYCCWVPLNSYGYHMSIHCPGCRAPGIIVDDYNMLRNTFGYEDKNNDRIADNPLTIIDPNNYSLPTGQSLNLNTAILGDMVTDYLAAHFQSGDNISVGCGVTNNGCNIGYTQSMMTNQGMSLDVLQLYKRITMGGCQKMDLRINTATLYVDSIVGTPSTALDPEHFESQYTNNVMTLFKIGINPAFFQSPSALYERQNSGNDLEELFTFRLSDIISGSTGNYTFNPNSPYQSTTDLSTIGFDFMENQRYRMVVTYEVEGNSWSTYYNKVTDDLEVQSDILTWMWLIGEGNAPLPTIATHEQSFPPMPNLLGEIIDLTNNAQLHFPGTNCNSGAPDADQYNFVSRYKFFCENFGNSFHFLSSDFHNVTSFSDATSTTGCNKIASSRIFCSTGGIMSFVANTNIDHFPFEVRPPALLPIALHYHSFPPGYTLANCYMQTLTRSLVGIYYTTPERVHLNPNSIMSGSAGTITPTSGGGFYPLDFLTLPIRVGSTPAFTPPIGNHNSLTVGDENADFIIRSEFLPDCNASSFDFNGSTSSDVEFGRSVINLNTQQVTVTPIQPKACLTPPEWYIKQGEYWQSSWRMPSPNLAINWLGPQIKPNTNKACWKFTITNFSGSGVTAAPNVFIREPSTNPNLVSWELSYSYNGFSSSAPMPPTSGIFKLFPITQITPAPSYANMVPGPIPVTGELCAEYHQCYNALTTIPVNWGWNCENIIPATPCHEETTDITLENELTDVQLDHIIPPTGITLCDDATTTTNIMTACFRNMQLGTVKPTTVYFTGATSPLLDLKEVTIINPNPPTPLPGTYTFQNLSGSTLDIQPGIGSLFGAAGGTPEYMYFSDEICIEAKFNAKCQFGYMMQLPDMVLEYVTYCGEVKTVEAPFPAVDITGTKCTDCFQVTKTASIDPVIQGTETVSYTFDVCCRNVPGSYQVYLGDNYPAGFTASVDPFGGNLIPVSINVPNPIATQNLITCETLGDIAEGTMSIPGSNTPDQCNEALLYDDAVGNNLISTSQACVTVLPGCRTLYTDPAIFEIDNGQQYSNLISNTLFTSATEYIVKGQFIIDQNAAFALKTFHMEGGAEISVNAGNTLNFKSVTVDGCNKLYRGIKLNNAAILNGTLGSNFVTGGLNNYISGAENAVYVNDYCTASLNYIQFMNNYRSVYAPPARLVQQMSSAVVRILSCDFLGTGSMHPHYKPNIPVGNYPFTGIEVNKMMLDMRQFSRGHNTFDGLSNGIILVRAGLLIDDATFLNIQPDAAYNYLTNAFAGLNYNGSGIYGNAFKTSFYIRQQGMGGKAGDPYSFISCHYGIVADRSPMSSKLNKMKDMGTGYHCRYSTGYTDINDNEIQSDKNGIELIMYDGARDLFVENNEITFGAAQGPPNYWGVRAEGANISGNHYISDNTINFGSGAMTAYGGIFANATTDLRITNNHVVFDNVNNNYFGIFATGNDAPVISCNEINRNVTPAGALIGNKSIFNSGIGIMMGSDPTVSCNLLDQCNNGLYVIGTVTGNNTEFKANNFNNHTFGFRYSISTITATIPQQDFKGNTWNVTQLPMGWYHAFNEDQNPNIPTYLVGPSANVLPPVQVPLNWFQQDPFGTDLTCTPEDCPVAHHAASPEPDIDHLIASGGVENDPYTEETQWMLAKELYKRLHDNPALMTGDVLLSAFYAANSNATLGGLSQLDAANAALFAADSLTDSIRALKASAALSIYNVMALAAAALDSAVAIDDTAAMAAAFSAMQAGRAAAMLPESEAYMVMDSANTVRELGALLNKLTNSGLVSANTPEENEKRVNEIYLQLVKDGGYSFTEGEITDLYAIAHQCPLSGGNAVFRARTLYALVDVYEHYNDFELCPWQGYQLRKENNSSQTNNASRVKIFPNPANDRATLEYNIESDNLVFELYTVTEQKVLTKKLNGKERQYQFNTSELKPAIYFYYVKNNGKLDAAGKLVIAR